MGDKVSFFDSLVVTLFSMTVVFIVLIVIAYLINLLKVLSTGKKVKENVPVVESNEDVITEEENSEELVAVIAAAVAASMGLNIPDINIKTIRRIPQDSAPWAEMGKKEQLLGKL